MEADSEPRVEGAKPEGEKPETRASTDRPPTRQASKQRAADVPIVDPTASGWFQNHVRLVPMVRSAFPPWCASASRDGGPKCPEVARCFGIDSPWLSA